MAQANVQPRQNFSCFRCKFVIKGGYSSLTKHFRHDHAMKTCSKSKASLVCGQNGCKESFDNFSDFNYHLRFCKLFAKGSLPPQPIPVQPVQNPVSVNTEGDLDNSSQVCDLMGSSQSVELKDFFAKLMLDLKAKHNVHHAALDYLSLKLREGLNGFQTLECEGNNFERESTLATVIESFTQLGSQQKRTGYFKTNFNFIEPEELFVDRSTGTVMRNGRIMYRDVNNTFQYIFLRRTLTALFSNDAFRRLYFSEAPSSDGFIRSDRDSNFIKLHPLFSNFPNAIRIQLYYDDVETVNALGSKTKKHELGMFLFRILNLPNVENSKLANIFPIAICTSIQIKKHGFDFIFSRIMDEVKELESEDGMLLHIPGFTNGLLVRGSIAAVCADSKAAHELGGFLSPSANKFCRLCLIDRKDIKNCNCFDQLNMRNRNNYEDAVKESSDCIEKSRGTGILKGCLLNLSKYFHVAENFILDATHDFLEGVVPFMIKLLLRYLISLPQTAISAALLNRRIELFHYAFNDLANKPSPKFTTKGLKKKGNYLTKQRAAQNWCLVRMLPFLIGDLVSEGNDHYTHFLQLLDIMDIVMSPKLANEHIVVLEDLIRQFVDKFTELYPDVQPINKFHHMVHFPDIIRLHGPPVNYWCMRYEAFLNIVKQYSKSTNNFVNFAKSTAVHLQSIFCANMIESDRFQKEQLQSGSSITGLFSSFVSHSIEIPPDGVVSKTKWIKFNGWEYRPNSVVLIKHSYESVSGLPEFAQVNTIFVYHENPYFLVTSLITSKFDSHFHSFEVEMGETEEKSVVGLCELPECEPLWIIETLKEDSPAFVSLRHWV